MSIYEKDILRKNLILSSSLASNLLMADESVAEEADKIVVVGALGEGKGL